MSVRQEAFAAWRERRIRHEERLAPFARDRVERMAKGRKHPVNDFLFEYYSFRPAELLRWSPGAGVALEGAVPGDLAWSEFEPVEGGLALSAARFPERRRSFLDWAIRYQESIRDRPPLFHCWGLHEWAMVYRAADLRHRTTPLRLTDAQIADVVEADGVRCTHYDAFRFFTPEALPLNRTLLTREATAEHDQPGCLHATMDLYRYAFKIAPFSTGELIGDAFLLAWEARRIDMRASPYDLSAFGVEPITMETKAGREEYVENQRELARKAAPIRERLIGEYRRLQELIDAARASP
jgi:hypothetical protein